ncbi:MAG: helix-hairpin-helix domain-containing protein [Terriglobales bacterium]
MSAAGSSARAPGAFELFERLGAKAIYMKLLGGGEKDRMSILVRDYYYVPLLTKMCTSNQSLRRFWAQRRVAPDMQQGQARSFAVEISQKMHASLTKHLGQGSEDGFKVLLPAYVQRSVHNAVVDHIRQEWEWERATLQDLNLDPEQEDPRQNTADDPNYMPENRAISAEQVRYLNQLRQQMEKLLKDKNVAHEPIVVVDCIYGMGLTEHSRSGVEMTMREVCDKLALAGETQARKIARCQVLLDKGLDMIRSMVREKLPGVAEFFQSEVNVNTASRRELGHYLSLTEGEVDRVVAGRQFYTMEELAQRGAVKANRVDELRQKGAVAAFVPVDVNSATTRDLIDILGVPKESAQKIAAARPFTQLAELSDKKIVDHKLLEAMINRGAVLRVKPASAERVDLNKAAEAEITATGVPQTLAQRVIRGRPFSTWADLEEYMSCDSATWAVVRQKFCLGLTSG